MALAIYGVSVVISNTTAEARLPGGLAAYERECPNGTYCSDGRICAVAFMVEADARAFIEHLTSYHFQAPRSGDPSDVALIAEGVGCLHPCDWLDVDLRTAVAADGQQVEVTIAWLRGETPGPVMRPAGLKPGALQSVSGADLRLYDLVGTERDDGGRVETYRHRDTGQVIFVGRPEIITPTSIRTRYLELTKALKELEERPQRKGYLQASKSFYERTRQLVKDTHAQEPGPLLLQGIAARLLGEWELAAESFRAVTALRPSFVLGWLDLTGALGVLGRPDEAESCARQAITLDANSPLALGNLAWVLLKRGNVEEAFTTINRALENDPTNVKNQLILRSICEARDQRVVETRTPWYRRLRGW